eukprot:scpid93639/ scgid7735/ 
MFLAGKSGRPCMPPAIAPLVLSCFLFTQSKTYSTKSSSLALLFYYFLSSFLKTTMSLALRCARALRPAGIQLRCVCIMELHRGVDQCLKVKVSKFDQNNQVYIDIRKFTMEEKDDFVPTKKGISLSVEQFENLAQDIPRIQQMIKEEE